MTGGASLAKAGERIVSITERPPLECYGGALSAFGASLRNAGDSLAQSGATCKNKFGMEIAGDEAREAAVCLEEAAVKIRGEVGVRHSITATFLTRYNYFASVSSLPSQPGSKAKTIPTLWSRRRSAMA